MPSGNPSSAIGDGRQTVTTAGTAVRLLSGGSVHGNSVCITALSTNTGIIAVGASTVVAAAGTRRGVALSAGQSVSFDCDPTLIYIDSTVNGEGVSFAYSSR